MHHQLCAGQAVYNEAIALHCCNGQKVWARVTLEPFRDTHNEIIEGRCILVDTTLQKQLEEQLRHAQRMEPIGTLAGGVAHDLSNILSAIVSYPDLLLMDVPRGSALYDPLIKIKGAGKRASAIVQDLLTLSRRGVSINEVISLNLIVQEYLVSPEYDDLVARHPDIQVEIDLSSALTAIKGSAVHLTKTLMNVVLNAAEAMPQGGRIQISTRNQIVDDGDERLKGRPGEHAVLSVIDNGYGIAPEDLKKVFEPFFTKKVMGRSGTGLGMAIVWAAVQDHNGFIHIQSKVGQGTRVELFFPGTTEKQAGTGLQQPSVEPLGKGERILVVDDNDEHREIAIRMLSRLGYEVNAVESGEAAIEKFRNASTPDLVVLDMVMGSGMDGLSTYRRLLEYVPKQKAVMASAMVASGGEKKALALGVGAYVKKPYSLNEIGAAVRCVLDMP